MSMSTLFQKFRDALAAPDAKIETLEPVNVTGRPDDVFMTASSQTATNNDKLVTLGWRNDGTKIRLHAGFIAALVTTFTYLQAKFLRGYHYMGAVSRTMVDGKIATVTATTTEAYADQIGFRAALAYAIRFADFDGLLRWGTRSNVMNFATPASTNLLVLTIGGRDYVLPQIPGTWRDGDMITHCVDPNHGVVLVSKIGDTTVYEVNLQKIAEGTEDIAVAIRTTSPIVEIGKALAGEQIVAQVTTKTSIVEIGYDDEHYIIASETDIGVETDTAFMGSSASGMFSFMKRDENGGKSEIFLVPASDLPEEISKSWKDSTTVGSPTMETSSASAPAN
ncbi:TPA: hypothetical protein DDZ10_03705 [Candidatus Uhrbacteria bacterium]|nr:hypothetical protein [Candidatus Uhrbacteria bacterium]